VLNPDVRITADPFDALAAELTNPRVGVAAPLVVDAAGEPEDNARRFPSAWSLTAKLLGLAPRLDYAIGSEPFSPDWVAGMFLALRRETFAAVDGFDERYFLYYEDVDLCRRLRRSGFDVRLVPGARYRVGASAGYGTDDCFRGSASLTIRNMFRQGRLLEIPATPKPASKQTCAHGRQASHGVL
jgi:GT2 family glycosyltransferase